MEDSDSPLIGLVVFLLLLAVDMVLHGFMAAVENVNGSSLEKKAEEGNKRSVWLLQIKNDSGHMLPALQSVVTFISVIVGIYQSRLYGRMLAKALLDGERSFWVFVACYALITVAAVFLLVSLGVLAPQKIAARKAESWAYRLAGIMRGLVAVFTPFGFLADRLSDLAVRIFGMDPNENVDDVTEEEIISMVNEGHEQGVLMASEAEMIHKIFEFGDKEAKDIMTHRKNMVSIDGSLKLTEAMEFMLEKSNSRFPVYQEDIDNIVGVVHIKDAMIQSRDRKLLGKSLLEIPGLVREVSFIPETRNINSLFQSMQSKKIHMVIVVDEYGQTAGLVAMEDILEEIVGNILDEYDEEDTMIVEQGDGSFLMKGMAPLDEVCEVLGLEDQEMEDYDTLNGYLISLIDKIPKDHEVFQVQDRGYLFQVLFVENKMIQTVKVIPAPKEGRTEEEERETNETPDADGKAKDSTCQDSQSMIE